MANSSSIMEDICNQTMQLASSNSFSVILALEVSVAPIGVIMNILLVVAVLRSPVFHINLRLLLAHLSLNAIAYCASSMARVIHALVTMRWDPCQLVVSMFSCKLQELAVVLPLNNLMYSIVTIAIERLYATVRRDNYEYGHSILLSLVLMAVTWIIALGFQLSPIVNIPRTVMAPFCVNILLVTKSMGLIMLIFNIGQECVGLFLYMVTYILNKLLYFQLINKSSKHSLTSRFQMAQNIQVCRFMLPSVFVHMACWIPTNTFVASVVAGMDLQFIQKVELIHVAYFLAMIYCVIHPVLCFGLEAKLRNRLLQVFTRSKVMPAGQERKPEGQLERVATARPRQKTGGDDHFDIMIKTWEQIAAS